ncbi:sigma-70 family RNA polymerase sigma factor [Paenibacillus yanchengensis]|uniref:RNA polymerase sigma factor n=1 Tax=Paenibacillus yanchengensis TaxID=2035833 RepID=A0ABW4YJE6_9BACL
MLEEQELIYHAKQGDSNCLAKLLQANYDFVYHYVLKVTLNKQRTEDLVQDTMVIAIEKIATFQEKSKFSTWLMTIASRLLIDRSRRAKLERLWLHTKKQQLMHHDDRQQMEQPLAWMPAWQAAAELPEKYRMVIILKYYYQFTQTEIASLLQIAEGTVKSRINKALTLLRKEYALHEK